MPRLCFAILYTFVAIICIPGCASSPNGETGDAATLDRARLERMMLEKLDHSSKLLGALSLADFETIEHSANRLYDISSESSWLIQETVAYTALAESFREITLQLAASAREQDLEACEQTYLKLTESCVKCHDYLRQEALGRQMPGRITRRSLLPGTDDILAVLDT